MYDAAPEWVTEEIRTTVISGRSSPSAVLFLLRTFADSDRQDMRDAIELGLTSGLRLIADDVDPGRRCEWLGVFAEAAAVSDDDRLVDSVRLQLAPTIDALEQFIRAAYEPGEGLIDGTAHDQLHSAIAFLTAFELTGRLPYSMLAEELLQTARRRWSDKQGPGFDAPFAVNATAAQVLCRLAALHRDPEYAAAAVVAPDARYADEAEQILRSLEPNAREHVDAVAEYGMALLDWFALCKLPN